jgi:hypothetical protein
LSRPTGEVFQCRVNLAREAHSRYCFPRDNLYKFIDL